MTAQFTADVIRLARRGMTNMAISQTLNCSHGSVSKVLARAGDRAECAVCLGDHRVEIHRATMRLRENNRKWWERIMRPIAKPEKGKTVARAEDMRAPDKKEEE